MDLNSNSPFYVNENNATCVSSGNGDEPLRRSRRVRKQPARYGSTDRACQELSKKNTRSSSPDESTISNLLNKAGETCPLPVPASENTVPVSENSITINQSKAQISCEDDVTESLSVNSQTAPHDHEPTNSGSSTNSQILESDFSENNQIVDAILDEPEIASFDLTGLESIFHNYSADQASLSSTTDPDALSETVIESVASSVESTVVETNIANSPLINSQTVVSSTDSPNTNSPKASTENSFNANETEIVTKDKPGTPTVTHDIPKTQTVTQKTPSHTSAETAIQDPSRKEFVTQAKPVTQGIPFVASARVIPKGKTVTFAAVISSSSNNPVVTPILSDSSARLQTDKHSQQSKDLLLDFWSSKLIFNCCEKHGTAVSVKESVLDKPQISNMPFFDRLQEIMPCTRFILSNVRKSMFLTFKVPLWSDVTQKWPGVKMEDVKQGCLTVWLVRKQTIEEMIEDIKVSQVSHPEHTHDMVRKHFEGGDPDIATTSLKALLTCPIGKTRLTVPCRGRTCVHVQCLDATTMLSMNAKKQRWRCPLCSSETAYKDIIIDGLFMDILEEVNKLVEEVEFLADGMWTSKKRNDSCISINETDDEATPKKKSTNIVSTTDKENNLDSVFTVNSGENRSRCTSNTSCCNEQDRSNSNTNQHHRNNYNARQRQRNNSNNSNHSNNGCTASCFEMLSHWYVKSQEIHHMNKKISSNIKTALNKSKIIKTLMI
ncbi:PIAS2-like protein [Mya arenaria]|uniref:PIAS2-like protein n=1 Tax=Mya arenaria TaxID=6604 RepID=A0ABY7DQP8_MYAAR|nr:PIAS2-like protein [Mya arenaria]